MRIKLGKYIVGAAIGGTYQQIYGGNPEGFHNWLYIVKYYKHFVIFYAKRKY